MSSNKIEKKKTKTKAIQRIQWKAECHAIADT